MPTASLTSLVDKRLIFQAEVKALEVKQTTVGMKKWQTEPQSVGGVGVVAAGGTRRRGDRVSIGGVLPAVSIQAMRGIEGTS